jgi:hypothetical protein
VVVVLVEPVSCALVVVMPEPVVILEPMVVIGHPDQPVVMALVVVEMAEPVVIAGPVVTMDLVMVDPVVMPLVVVVVMAGPVEMAKPVEYALVLPPVVVVVVVIERYNPGQPKVEDQPIRYLVYATEWYCRRIRQGGNSSHLQWGCLSFYPHILISRVAPHVRMHIGAGSIFPQINPQQDPCGPWQLLLSS